MSELCTQCPDTFDHTQHATCYKCHKRVPVTLTATAIVNSTICEKCRGWLLSALKID